MKQAAYILIIFLFSSEIKAQCAMCKAVVESGNPDVAEGLNTGITFLMAVPYVLVGLLFYALYRYKRRTKI